MAAPDERPVTLHGDARFHAAATRPGPERRQLRAELLHSLCVLSDEAARADAPEGIYAAAMDTLEKALATDRVSVLLLDAGGKMRFTAWRRLSTTYRRAVDGHSPWQPTDRNPTPIFVSDVLKDASLTEYHETFTREGIRALGFIPLVNESRLIGKFMVYFDNPHEFRDEEIDFALTVAGTVAFSIERQRGAAALRQREQYLACLTDISADLLGAHDTDEVLPDIINRLREVSGADRCYLFENHRDPDGVLLTTQRFESCARGIEPQAGNPALIGFPFEASGFGRWVDEMSAGRQICGPVVSFPESERAVLEPQGIRWLLSLPLRVAGAFHGFIGFDSCRADSEWTDQDVALLRAAANAISAAISRRNAERALRMSEELFRSAFESSAIGIGLISIDGLWLRVNRSITEMFGYSAEELAGINFLDMTHPDDRAACEEWIDSMLRGVTPSCRLEKRYIRKDSRVIWTFCNVSLVNDPSGKPLYFVSQIEDITDRKTAEETLRSTEEQLRRSQKMEAVGRLAGGVAHDFNNLLTAISGYAELLLKRLPPEEHTSRHAQEIHKAAARATTLTRQLLAFSRQQVMKPKVLDLNSVVSNLGLMLHRLIGENIEFITILDPRLGRVKADPGQIEQVIVNMAVNARDAMPSGGRLTIKTTDELTPAGRGVRLSVTDTGCGMDQETLSHLFEPFFTTKEPGKGTGLGLSTVYGIVKQSGGTIEVESQPGVGSTFSVFLPIAFGQPTDADEQGDTAAAPIVTHGATVLVVEDEEAVRSLLVEVLRSSGYEILEARDGREALEMSKQHAGPIELILTDIVMPGLSGPELMGRIAATRPNAKVLYISGYTEDAEMRRAIEYSGVPFLQKPFSPQGLSEKVSEILNG